MLLKEEKERWVCVIANVSSKKKQFTLNKFQLISTGIHIATFTVMIYISICFIFNYKKKKKNYLRGKIAMS